MQKRRLSPRKRPRQQRAQDTVDAILGGAAQVLKRHGYAAGTTNRIAERAGVSIGSLYEYFPNKDAILVALVERHLDEGMERVHASLDRAVTTPSQLRQLLNDFVSAMVALHGRSPQLHRVLFEEAPHPPESHACVLRMEEGLAHRLEAILRGVPGVAVDDFDTAAHFVVQTTEALAHRFVLHGLHELDETDFTAQTTRLLERYLGVQRGSPRRPSAARR